VPGYKLDPEALEKAIKDLEDIYFRVQNLTRKAAAQPGELTAQDPHTRKAYDEFKKKSADDQESLFATCEDISKKLRDKITTYKEALKEYKASEEAATIDTNKIRG
jgi:hypothetical protein